jgi:hypothetical protein
MFTPPTATYSLIVLRILILTTSLSKQLKKEGIRDEKDIKESMKPTKLEFY